MNAKINLPSMMIGVTACTLGVALFAFDAAAQTAKDLVGTWTPVSITAVQDGKTIEPYGPNPKALLMFDDKGRYTSLIVRKKKKEREDIEPYGPNPKALLMFDDKGRYTSLIVRSDLPKFASNNRTTGTPEENKAVVQGSNAHFGTYAVEGDKLVLRIESATFPNSTGAEQRRPFTLTGDELKVIVPVASGGGTSTLVWKRAK